MADVFEVFWSGIAPVVPMGSVILAVILISVMPPVGRGPWRARRDPWRGFRFATRRRVFERAAGRCEAAAFLVWGRCKAEATEADHIYPWSRGGATILSNGQALCRAHNRAKSAVASPWWYVLRLERRRRAYVPSEAERRVHWQLSDEDRARRNATKRDLPRQPSNKTPTQ